jgi:acetoin utilization deacetylase AcuC-like enzyme
MALKVGIVRDERYLEHKTGHTHPDHPKRLKAIYLMLDKDFPQGLGEIEPELVSLEYLELVHSSLYIKKVLKTAEYQFTSLAPDTPVSAKTYLAAGLAVGGCIKALKALLSGHCDICFSLVRPPGHHALPDRAGGFCVYNNLGITARYAIERYGLRRILIIDWDIHHGNALNDLFFSEREVLYFSSHDLLLYPYTGQWEEIGSGEGEGYTINIPIPRGLKDEDFYYVYQQVMGPLVRRYNPEIILIAAGFDAHRKDPIGRSMLTEQAFKWVTHLLLDLRAEVNGPPILLALEGGYDVLSLTSCIKEVITAMINQGKWEIPPFTDIRMADELINKARRIHAKYNIWVD